MKTYTEEQKEKIIEKARESLPPATEDSPNYFTIPVFNVSQIPVLYADKIAENRTDSVLVYFYKKKVSRMGYGMPTDSFTWEYDFMNF